MFKDAISLPALAYKMLLICTTEKSHYLRKKSLFKEEVTEEFFNSLKRYIVGGPYIIFHRYLEAVRSRQNTFARKQGL